jgi:ubiquitin thioesterase OTU1
LQVANLVVGSQDKYTAAMLGMAPADYANKVLDRRHWGGGIELALLSDLYSVEIYTFDLNNLVVYPFGTGRRYTKRVFFLFDEAHYDELAYRTPRDEIIEYFLVTDIEML